MCTYRIVLLHYVSLKPLGIVNVINAALQISVYSSGPQRCSTVKTLALLWMPDLMSEHSP